jgi:hypothetical protein
MTSRKFDDVFGGLPRKAESKFGQREMDLARSIQEVTEEVMLRLSRTMHRETGVDYFCLAGGVALNCAGPVRAGNGGIILALDGDTKEDGGSRSVGTDVVERNQDLLNKPGSFFRSRHTARV